MLNRFQVEVYIFPEGRRNNSGSFLPFKKGAFHIAIDAQVYPLKHCLNKVQNIWLINWIGFYVVSAIFQPCNGGPKYLPCTTVVMTTQWSAILCSLFEQVPIVPVVMSSLKPFYDKDSKCFESGHIWLMIIYW